MSEVIASIFNIITMLCLLAFAAYLAGVLAEHKIQLFKRLLLCIINLKSDPIKEVWHKKIYFLCYVIIPALVGNVLVIARQFNIGKMYIRADIGFVLGAVLWITLPLFFIGILKRLEKEELKNK